MTNSGSGESGEADASKGDHVPPEGGQRFRLNEYADFSQDREMACRLKMCRLP